MKFTSSLSILGGLLLLLSGERRVYGSDSSVTCDDAYECESETLDYTTADCYGYYGCYDADIVTTYHTNTGAFASYNADVEASYSYSYGLASSYYASMRVGYLFAYGYLAAIYADIESKSSSLIIYFYGYYAGYYSSVFCYEDNTCKIYCGNSYGCTGVDFYCYSGATCYYYCDEDEVCPTIYSGLASTVGSEGEKGEIATVYGDLTDEEIDGKKEENRKIKERKMEKERETGRMDEELYWSIVKMAEKNGDEEMMLAMDQLPREMFSGMDGNMPHSGIDKNGKGSELINGRFSALVYATVGALIMTLFGMLLYCACLKNYKSDYQYTPIN